MTITVDMTQLKRYEQDLKHLAARSYPFASRFTIHTAAKKARFKAVDIVKEEMILKNKFTQQSIQFWPERPSNMSLNPRNQMALMGSTQKYMRDQEFGAVKKKKGKVGTVLPTSESAGQGEINPRTRLVKKINKLANIKLQKKNRKKGKNKKQHAIIAIEEAKKAGKKFVYLETYRTKGIFSIKGSKKKRKIRMLYNLEHKQVTIPKNPWMKPAVDYSNKLLPEIYRDALIRQLKRLETYKF